LTPGASLGHWTPVKKQPIAPSSPEIPPETTPETVPVTFDSLGLEPRILKTLAGMGFEHPTPIQVGAIPPLLEGKDLVGQARTGTGKTAAFGLPLITRLGRSKSRSQPRAIVLTPTRELALQVTEALQGFAASTPLRFLTVYGGAAYGPQLRGLREGVDVVIGTPGRCIDLMERGSLQLGEVEVVVLDEADEMLEMGFIEAVETILSGTPEATRQVALFSATMPAAIRKVAERYLKEPVGIKDATQNVVAIEQRYVQVPSRFKREALLKILRSEDRGATLVFASTRASCAEAADALAVAGIPAEPLHGDLTQPARERVIELLRARRVEVVVATDIAARGIDIEHLTHIINLDLPKNVEIYTHRIGRTGRAGRSGKAISLVVPRESLRFTDALRRRGVQIEEMFIPSEHDLAMRQREAVVTEVKTRLADPAHAALHEDARRWVSELVAGGVPADDVAAAVLGLVGEGRGLRLGKALDKGVPPWARQPGVQAKADRPASEAAAHVPARAKTRGSTAEPSEHTPRDGASATGEGWVIVGLGRNHGVRPADLVGALTNELGLTGRDIGRVELRDTSSLIGVPAAFADRLGEDAWPVTIRRVETTVRRHTGAKPTPRRTAPPPRRDEEGEGPAPRPHRKPEPYRSTAPERDERRPAAHEPRDTPRPGAQETRDTRRPPAYEPRDTRRPAAQETRDTRRPAAQETRDTRRPAARETRDTQRPAAQETRDTRRPAAHAARDTRRTSPHERSETRDTRRPTAHAAHDPRRAAAPSDTRRPASKRPPTSRSAGDHPPRRAVDVAPRVPRTPR